MSKSRLTIALLSLCTIVGTMSSAISITSCNKSHNVREQKTASVSKSTSFSCSPMFLVNTNSINDFIGKDFWVFNDHYGNMISYPGGGFGSPGWYGDEKPFSVNFNFNNLAFSFTETGISDFANFVMQQTGSDTGYNVYVPLSSAIAANVIYKDECDMTPVNVDPQTSMITNGGMTLNAWDVKESALQLGPTGDFYKSGSWDLKGSNFIGKWDFNTHEWVFETPIALNNSTNNTVTIKTEISFNDGFDLYNNLLVKCIQYNAGNYYWQCALKDGESLSSHPLNIKVSVVGSDDILQTCDYGNKLKEINTSWGTDPGEPEFNFVGYGYGDPARGSIQNKGDDYTLDFSSTTTIPPSSASSGLTSKTNLGKIELEGLTSSMNGGFTNQATTDEVNEFKVLTYAVAIKLIENFDSSINPPIDDPMYDHFTVTNSLFWDLPSYIFPDYVPNTTRTYSASGLALYDIYGEKLEGTEFDKWTRELDISPYTNAPSSLATTELVSSYADDGMIQFNLNANSYLNGTDNSTWSSLYHAGLQFRDKMFSSSEDGGLVYTYSIAFNCVDFDI